MENPCHVARTHPLLRCQPHLLALLLLAPGKAASAQDSFSPELRWTYETPPTEVWIPGSLAFGVNENHVFASANFGMRRLMLIDADDTPTEPRFVDEEISGDTGVVEIATAERGTALYSLSQFPNPTEAQRRTEISRYDAVSAQAGAPFEPQWTHDMGTLGNLAARLVTNVDGSVVVAAMWTGSIVQVDRLDGETGALLGRRFLTGDQLVALDISENGERVAVAVGAHVYVLNGSSQTVFHQQTDATPATIALAGDGRSLLVGRLGRFDEYREDPTWALRTQVLGAPSWIATRLDQSHDGSTVAVAWWNAVTGSDLKFELRFGAGFQVLYTYDEVGIFGGLQNLPHSVHVSRDGSRALYGGWGDNDSDPELILVDRDTLQAIWELDLPGSVRGLDLDSTGTRIAVSHKETHANGSGSRGSIRLYDTGERDLQLTRPAVVGGELSVTTYCAQAPALCVFAVGRRAPEPSPLGGSSLLRLDRRTLRTYPVAVTAPGPVEWSVPLPANPDLHGRELAIQAIVRNQNGLFATRHVLDVTIL